MRWDGVSWSSVGTVDVDVDSLASYDGGEGPELYAGGGFNKVNGVFSPHIARWNGSVWQPVGVNSFQSSFRDLVVYDDGGGERLIGIGPPGAWAWDGSDWEPFQGGAVGSSRCSAVQDENLYLGGGLDLVGGSMLVDRIARFGPDCDCPPLSYCTAGTTTNGCNAAISAAGLASVSFTSGFQVDVAGVEGEKQGLLYFGISGSKATPWGGGSTSWACVKGPHQRLSPMSSGGTAGSCDGAFSTDFNAWMAANPAKTPQAGVGVWMQAWFRDPAAPKTTAFSDALFFTVCQ